MKWSGLINLVKFIVGFAIAIALLGAGGVLATRYVATKLMAPPPRPTFANDKPAKPAAAKNTAPAKTASAQTQAASDSSSPDLAPGTYMARVVQPIGLILRDGPSRDASQIGGIEYNSRVIVLEESADKVWQKVRVENSDREGWVKAGNTERTN